MAWQKQQIAALLLLVICSMPILLFCNFQAEQIIIQHRVMEDMKHSRLQTLCIPISSVNWYEKNKEIIVDGKMFDVQSYEIVGGDAEFTGLFDEEETVLLSQVERLQREEQANNQTDNPTIIFIFHIVGNIFLKENFTVHLWLALKPVKPICNINTLLSVDLVHPSPPPEIG